MTKPSPRCLIILLLSLSVIYLLQGSAQSQMIMDSNLSPRAGERVISTNAQEVSLILGIASHHAESVAHLTTDDFIILDNGHPPERITHFECDTRVPLRIAILIDTSDSVRNSYALERSVAARFLTRDLRYPDLAIVVAFNDRTQLLGDSTSDYAGVRRAIQRSQIGGQTALYDAVAFAVQELDKIQDNDLSRRIIIIMTDGEDNSSHVSLQEAVQAAQQVEAPIYFLQVGIFNPTARKDAISQLSDLTGGKRLGPLDEGGIPFSKIKGELRNQCTISYIPANTRPDGSFHRIDVRASRKLKLHYKQGYFAR